MKTMLLVAAVTAGVASVAQAAFTPLYSANFNAPTYTDGPLTSSTTFDATQTPGQDGWLASSGTTNLIAVSGAATNGVVTLTTTGQDVRRAVSPVTSGSVYLQAAINVTAAQAAGDYFFHAGDGGASNFYARTYIKSSGTGFVMALGTGSGAATYGSTVLSFNTPYTILVRYDIVSGTANDTGALFINPTTADGTGDTAYVAATTIGIDATTIGSVNLRQGSAANAPSLTIDNIVVSAVPEPATLAALGLGGLLLRRRRA